MTTNSLSINNNLKSDNRIANFASKCDLSLLLNDPIEWFASTRLILTLTEIYSALLEEEITPQFTLHLVNTQFALFFTVMPADISLFGRLACLAWFALSLCLAKRAYTR